jgi:hypothetical protein
MEGLDYDKARSEIVEFGWKPFAGKCAGVNAITSKQHPEVIN